jgi:hypothetical protein
MAICRCINQPPVGRTKKYVRSIEPINYGNGSMICGRKDCTNDGLIWLTKDESNDYNNGIRIFSFDSAVCKAKVK